MRLQTDSACPDGIGKGAYREFAKSPAFIPEALHTVARMTLLDDCRLGFSDLLANLLFACERAPGSSDRHASGQQRSNASCHQVPFPAFLEVQNCARGVARILLIIPDE